jgi:hypothetical protein
MDFTKVTSLKYRCSITFKKAAASGLSSSTNAASPNQHKSDTLRHCSDTAVACPNDACCFGGVQYDPAH